MQFSTIILPLLATLAAAAETSYVTISSLFSTRSNFIDYRSTRASSTREAATSTHASATSAKASHTGAAAAVKVGDMGVVMAGVLGVAALL
jgi:hypothetical protein